MNSNALKETLVSGHNHEGMEFHGRQLRVSRHYIVFEINRQGITMQVSEAISDFKIVCQDRHLYLGNMVIQSIVDTGLTFVCEAQLSNGWLDPEVINGHLNRTQIQEGFRERVQDWQQLYYVPQEFRVLVSDIQTFLNELRMWCEQLELGFQGEPGDKLQAREREVAETLGEVAFPALDALFEKLEANAGGISAEQQAAHQHFIRHQLHPLILTTPFAGRVVRKPLGYPGDYEMVNMILRDPHEGPSLYAKVLNRWFIKQPPAEAHRNRVKILVEKLSEETMRARTDGRILRVFNVGSGPAGEVQDFLKLSPLADSAQFTLLDFNEETIQFAKSVLESMRRIHGRSTSLRFLKKSVVHLLKGRSRATETVESKYDFVYCAGLFDYLPDSVCKQLVSIFYDMLAPNGLLLATNVDPSNPINSWLGHVLEWKLICRSGLEMQGLCPADVKPSDTHVYADYTGVNVFLEIRKPA